MRTIDSYFIEQERRLQQREESGLYYFSGAPLTGGEMSRYVAVDRWERDLKPSLPIIGKFIGGLMQVTHDAERPVVCVTSLAQMAEFRALSHQAQHTNLPKHQRRTGWKYNGDMPKYMAT